MYVCLAWVLPDLADKAQSAVNWRKTDQMINTVWMRTSMSSSFIVMSCFFLCNNHLLCILIIEDWAFATETIQISGHSWGWLCGVVMNPKAVVFSGIVSCGRLPELSKIQPCYSVDGWSPVLCLADTCLALAQLLLIACEVKWQMDRFPWSTLKKT